MTPMGAMIMSVFATIWWIVGMRAAGIPVTMLTTVPIGAALLLGQLARARKARGDAQAIEATEEARRGRVVGWASAAEGVGILVAVNVLNNIGYHDAIAPVIAMIVGLHFVPIARGLPAPAYYGTAALLIAVGVVGLMIADVSTRIGVVSAAAALILWGTAALALRGARAASPLSAGG